jgi:hypothetical protein
LTQIGFENTVMISGYLTLDTEDKTQQTFLEAHDLSKNSSLPDWTYLYGNSSAPYEDSVADIQGGEAFIIIFFSFTYFFIACSGTGNYVCVASWGIGPDSLNHTNTDTVHCFQSSSGSPLFSFDTIGSMFSISCFVKDNALYVGVGGKAEHANIMGSGGDLYFLKSEL